MQECSLTDAAMEGDMEVEAVCQRCMSTLLESELAAHSIVCCQPVTPEPYQQLLQHNHALLMQNQALRMQMQTQVISNRIIIFDWDDTLMCTTALKKNVWPRSRSHCRC